MKKVLLLTVVLVVAAGCGVSRKQRALEQERESELAALKQKLEHLSKTLEKQRRAIRELAQEYGTKKLDRLHKMKLERVGMLMMELTRYEALTLQAEARVNVLRRKLKSQDTQEQKVAEVKQKLTLAEEELELNKELESQFRQLFNEEDSEAIKVGRKQLEIDNLQTDMALVKEEYEKISRRIDKLESE